MKIIKSLLAITCSLALLCVSTLPAFADVQSPYDCLLSYGYSKEFLNSLTEKMILKIYNAIGDNEVASVEETVFQMDETGIIKPVNQFGTINENSLKITVESAEICRYGTDEIGLCMYSAVWEWISSKPALRYTDVIAIEWSNSIFCQADFCAQTTGVFQGASERSIINEYTAPSQSLQGGVVLEFSLRDIRTYDKPGGAVLLLLSPTEPMRKGAKFNTEIDFNYMHNKMPFGVGVSISVGGAGLSINTGPMVDRISKSVLFKYSR